MCPIKRLRSVVLRSLFYFNISFKTITTLHRTQVIQIHLITYFDSSANEYHPYHPPKSLHI